MTTTKQIQSALKTLAMDPSEEKERKALAGDQARAVSRLLGLRDNKVDALIQSFFTRYPKESDWPNECRFTRLELSAALAESGVGRCRIIGIESYLWLTPTPDEVPQVIHDLLDLAAREERRLRKVNLTGSPSLEKLCAFDFSLRLPATQRPALVADIECASTLEAAYKARVLGLEIERPCLVPTFFSTWATPAPALTYRDPKTLSLNRNVLMQQEHTTSEEQEWLQHHPSDWKILVDVDDFKMVNDVWGMVVGDQVLLALVNRLHQLVGDRCIRFRGDSWLVLHQGPDGPDVAEKIVDAVAAIALRPFPDVGCHNTSGDASRTQPTELSFTVSVGVASEDDFPSAVRHAEVACHRAKVQGKNCVCIAECLQSDVFPG